MAHNLGVDLKAPTWFASYAHKVFKNFSNNYGIVRRVLDNIAASDNCQAKDADDLLRHIRTLKFVVKLLLCVDFYCALEVVSQMLQVNIPFWKKTKVIEYFMVCLGKMVEGKPDHVLEFHINKADLQECVFAELPPVSKDVALTTPLRETCSLPHSTALADSTNLELSKVVVGNALTKGKVMFQAMISSINQRFTAEYLSEIKEKEQAASLFPLLNAAKVAANEDEFLMFEPVRLLLSKHSDYVEGTRNLSINIFCNRDTDMLKKCCSEIELYHCVFTTANLYLGAEHILSKIAQIFCSYPPESVIESMGSVIEKIQNVHGATKTSTNKKDIKDISDELVIYWKGPHISECDSIVKQALNVHFKGKLWHFISSDVCAKMHKVSAVVDKINNSKLSLSFMSH